MKIRLTNVYGYIDEWPFAKEAFLKAFTVKQPNAHWLGPMAGKPLLFVSEKKGRFLTGLLPKIERWANANNVPLEVEDTRSINPPKSYHTNIDLRDYQREAIEAALDNIVATIKIPTGGGKTYVMAGLVDILQRPTLVIVPRINLAIQTVRLFRKLGIRNVGTVGGGKKEWDRTIVVAVDQSAYKNRDKLAAFEAVIVDECHHASSKIYRDILRACKGAAYRIGLSGTPRNGRDDQDMYRESLLGPVVYELPTTALIQEGKLSRPTIRVIKITEPKLEYGDYRSHYKKGIVHNDQRNDIIAYLVKGFRGKTIILFGYIEHGQLLQARLPNALYMDGDTPANTRDQIIQGFNRSTEGILITSKVADEGIDFDSIHNLIVATGEKSPIKVIQRLGRGLRSDGEGDIVNVIDFYDDTSRYLRKQSKKRIRLYEQEGHMIKFFEVK